MSAHTAIEQQLLAILRHYANADANLTATTNFIKDLTLESVRVLEFVVEVEDAFDIAIDIDSLSDIHTVAELAAVVARLTQDRPA
ncbi:MAG: acyl carrier protein [Gammaproteobacteria bacterium]|nr:acyl carrier protein [Gammaproteobacteria bacterium]